jgi:hypothetical protein
LAELAATDEGVTKMGSLDVPQGEAVPEPVTQ